MSTHDTRTAARPDAVVTRSRPAKGPGPDDLDRPETPPPGGAALQRTLRHFHHGGHTIEQRDQGAERVARAQTSVTLTVEEQDAAAFVATSTPFDYLFDTIVDDPAAHLPAADPDDVAGKLSALAAAMVDDPAATDVPVESGIPPIYTYWGQFIDHDLTANTDRTSETSDVTRSPLTPVPPATVTANLRNLRQPQLNLDSLYGDGPTLPGGPVSPSADMYDGIRLKVGTVALTPVPGGNPIRGVRIPGVDDLARDLPRQGGTGPDATQALIGDGRNDENLIIAQLHVAFLRFHNEVVDWVRHHEPHNCKTKKRHFRRARQLVRWHYQWLVVNDFLSEVALPGAAQQVLLGGNQWFTLRHGRTWMPLEYSVAAYRFGHSMVRGAYDFNRNFGVAGPDGNTPLIPTAPFGLIFGFTGGGRPKPFLGDTQVLPFNWVCEFDRFVHRGSSVGDRFARKIDTRIAPPLFDMVNQVDDPATAPPIQAILKSLARRNLLRGYSLSIPTGQAAAAQLGIPALTPAQLQAGNSQAVNDALVAGGFLERTPLWFYVLKEAEAHANGESLGRVGSTIVSEVIVGQVRYDPRSYLNVAGGWSPADGVRFADGRVIATIADLIEFAGLPV